MNSNEIDGFVNDTLAADAEQFGGDDEPTAVPTHHVRIPDDHLAALVDDHEPVVTDTVVFSLRHVEWDEDADSLLDSVDTEGKFEVLLAENHMEKMIRGTCDWGIRHVDGINQFLVTSAGGISDDLGTDETAEERLPNHLQGYI